MILSNTSIFILIIKFFFWLLQFTLGTNFHSISVFEIKINFKSYELQALENNYNKSLPGMNHQEDTAADGKRNLFRGHHIAHPPAIAKLQG